MRIAVFRIRCHQDGRFAGKRLDGVFKLRRDKAMVGFHGLGRDGRRGDDPGDDANDEDGEQFLLDAVGGFAVKMLDLETDFFVSIMVLDRPAPII